MLKTAIVTGGSRGIGLGIVQELSADGYAVAIIGSSPRENCAANLEALTKKGVEHIYLQGSISSTEDINRCVCQAAGHFGRIDVLVNNAGIAPDIRADLLEMSGESFDRVVGTNTRGTMFMSQAVARQMIAQEPLEGTRGIIVNISSVSAEVSSVNRGEYCVSKAGIAMLTKLYADRLAPEQIFVYEVRPGIIDTEMTAGVKEKYDELFTQGVCPIRRWGTPQDVGRVVSALCSGKFRYTTGQVIDVDGGFHIRRL